MAQRKTVAVENTARAYLELLRAMGVKYFFGNAGTDSASLIDSFAKFAVEGKTTPMPIQVPHEFCAVSMAHGYHRASARGPGGDVCRASHRISISRPRQLSRQ